MRHYENMFSNDITCFWDWRKILCVISASSKSDISKKIKTWSKMFIEREWERSVLSKIAQNWQNKYVWNKNSYKSYTLLLVTAIFAF